MDGLVVATGHAMLELTLASVTGQLVRDTLDDSEFTADGQALSPARMFGRRRRARSASPPARESLTPSDFRESPCLMTFPLYLQSWLEEGEHSAKSVMPCHAPMWRRSGVRRGMWVRWRIGLA